MTSLSELVDELDHLQMIELENKIIERSLVARLENGRQTAYKRRKAQRSVHLMMDEDPRLLKMPEKSNFIDFVRLRFSIGGQQHLLQSARLACNSGQPEKIFLACLLHDVAVSSFIRSDHGYWGAALIEAYVDEKVSWAIRMHQCCRFLADPDVGYEYPESYPLVFGEDYQPETYIVAEYERAQNHKWYMSARQICVNALYAFDSDVVVEWDEFEDVLGRGFKQPPEGLGNVNIPASHMWRTLRRPSNAL
jgi:hypothetical protein